MYRKAIAGMFLAALMLVGGCAPKSGGGAESSGGLTLKKDVLSVGMNISYPPMEYYDADGKTPAGFDVELGKALARKLGANAEFVDAAWDGIFAGVNTNKYDCIISGVTITPERLAVHNFTQPYLGNAQAIVLLKGSPVTAQEPLELAGLRVGYQGETTSDIYMTKLASQGLQYTPYAYDTVMNCFDDLRSRRVDAIVCDSLVAVNYTAAEDSPFEMVWQGAAEETFGICLKKGNDALTAALEKALDELFDEGIMQELSLKLLKADLVSALR